VYVSNTLTYVGVRFFGHVQNLSAFRIYVTHTLDIHTAYAGYARHTLNTLKVRYSYPMNTLLIRSLRPVV